MNNLNITDNEIYDIYLKEKKRQYNSIEIIASENYVSESVLEATWSILTNKYSEGYPWKRYYWWNQFIDQIENIAIQRAKKLFNAKFVNVQPHSWSTANFSVYLSLLNPWDTILWMGLTSWWHLTHWHSVSFSWKVYKSIQYTTNEDWYIDYEQVRSFSLKYRPKVIVCWYSAYSRKLDYRKFKEIADEVWAFLFADISHIAWLIVSWEFENPIDIVDIVMTTTHKTLRWPRWAIILTNNKEISKKVDKAVFPWTQWWPLEHIIMAKAVAFKEALKPEFKIYINQVLKNIKVMESFFQKNDIKMITWWTDNHLLLLDMQSLWIDWTIAEKTLEKCDISCNKNTIPWDKSPFKPNWIRIGTPAITTRWLKEWDIEIVCDFILNALKNYKNEKKLLEIKNNVNKFMSKFKIFAR